MPIIRRINQDEQPHPSDAPVPPPIPVTMLGTERHPILPAQGGHLGVSNRSASVLGSILPLSPPAPAALDPQQAEPYPDFAAEQRPQTAERNDSVRAQPHPEQRSRPTSWLSIALRCGAVGLAGLGQWLLGQDREGQGLLCYLLGVTLFAVATLVTRDNDLPSHGAVRWPARGAICLLLVAIGQLVAVQLSRSTHAWWPVFLPWMVSIVAVFASVARVPEPILRWDKWEYLARWCPTAARARQLAIGGVVLVAAVLRLIDLEGIPRGIHGDEGEFGLIALDVVRGHGPSPFGVAFLGDPALYPHLLAPFVALLGANMTAVRLFSALVGIATVLLFYQVISELGGTRAGLIAATLLAGSATHLHFSRVGLNVVHAPFAVCLALWLLRKGMVSRQAVWYLGAGVAAGLGCYFHFSARIAVPILGLAFLWAVVARQITPHQLLRGSLLTAIGGLLSLSPLLSHTSAATEQLTEHMNSRLVWNHWQSTAALYDTTPGDWFGVLRGQAFATMSAFTHHADMLFFDFVGLPMVGALIAPFTILGLAALVVRPSTPQASLLLPWFIGPFIFGGVLVIEPGSFHRLLIALLPALAAAALVLEHLIALALRWQLARIGPILALILVLLVPVGTLLDTAQYFSADSRGDALAGVTTQARQLQALPPGTAAYVLAAPYVSANHGASAYLGQAIDRRDLYNPTITLPARPKGQPTTVLVNLTYQSWIPLISAYYPQAQVAEVRLKNGRLALYTITIPAGTTAQSPEAGLRGEILPLGGGPRRMLQDPALAYLRLSELGGGTFEADWTGRLRPPKEGNYRLEVVTDGVVTFTLDGEATTVGTDDTRDAGTYVLPDIAGGGTYDLQIRGTWADDLGALALYWHRDDGERELVPPGSFLPGP